MPGSEHFEALSFRQDGSFSVAASTLSGNVWDGNLYHFDSYEHFCSVPNLRMYSNAVVSGVNDIQWWDSTKLLAAVDEGNVEIWGCESPGNTMVRISDLTGVHQDMALCLGGVKAGDNAAVGDVLSGGGDGRVVGWDLAALKEVFRFNAHLGWVTSLATSPTQPCTFVTAGMDNFTKVWDKRNLKPLAHKIGGEVCNASVAWPSQDENIFAAGSEVGEVFVFDLRMLGDLKTTPLLSYSAHHRAVHRVAFSPTNSKLLASASNDCSVHLRQVESNLNMLSNSDHCDYVHGLAWHPDGSFFLTAGWDRKIVRHNLGDEDGPDNTNDMETEAAQAT